MAGSPSSSSSEQEENQITEDLAVIYVDAGSDHRVLISQAGLSDFYTIRLGRKPLADVIVTVNSIDGLECHPNKVTISPDNWQTPKKIRVSAASNTGSSIIAHEFIISHKASSEDPQYGEKYAAFKPSTIMAMALDDDAPFLWVFGSNDYGQLGLETPAQVVVPTLIESDEVANALINQKKVRKKIDDVEAIIPPHNIQNEKQKKKMDKNNTHGTHEVPRKSDTLNAIHDILGIQDEHHALGTAINDLHVHEDIPHSTLKTYMAPAAYISHRRDESSTIHKNRLIGQDIVQVKTIQRYERDELYMKTIDEASALANEMTNTAGKQAILDKDNDNKNHELENKNRPKSFLKYLKTRRAVTESARHTKRLGLFNGLAAGEAHSAFVTDKGKCYLMGQNNKGQLGQEENTNFKIPIKWNGLDVSNNPNKRIAQVSCGESHTVFVTHSGSVLSVGCGLNGRLGHGDVRPTRIPKVINRFKQLNLLITQVACGGKHNLALTTTNKIYSWGFGRTGALGLCDRPTREAQRIDVKAPTYVQQFEHLGVPYEISCGILHSAALCGNGKLMTWGWGLHGQLGRKCEGGQVEPRPAKLPKGLNARMVACGGQHTLALLDDNNVYAFGKNDFGQLGVGTLKDSYKPLKIQMLEHKDVSYLSCGRRFSLAVTEDGVLYSWGDNSLGQLGMKDQEDNTILRKKKRKKKKKTQAGTSLTHQRNKKLNSNEIKTLPTINIDLLGLHVIQAMCGDTHTLVTTLDNGSHDVLDSKSEALREKLKMQKYKIRLIEEEKHRQRILRKAKKSRYTSFRRTSVMTQQEMVSKMLQHQLNQLNGKNLGTGKKMKMQLKNNNTFQRGKRKKKKKPSTTTTTKAISRVTIKRSPRQQKSKPAPVVVVPKRPKSSRTFRFINRPATFCFKLNRKPEAPKTTFRGNHMDKTSFLHHVVQMQIHERNENLAHLANNGLIYNDEDKKYESKRPSSGKSSNHINRKPKRPTRPQSAKPRMKQTQTFIKHKPKKQYFNNNDNNEMKKTREKLNNAKIAYKKMKRPKSAPRTRDGGIKIQLPPKKDDMVF